MRSDPRITSVYQHQVETEILESHPATTATSDVSSNKLQMYFGSHVRALLLSCGNMVRAPFSSFMAIIVIAIALALPSALFVLLQNAKQISSAWADSSQISLYLKLNTTDDQVQALIKQLQEHYAVTTIKYISPQQGLTEFQQQTGMQNVIANLQTNPLPGVILLEPNASLQTPAEMNQLMQQLQQFPQVDTVQMDVEWIKRLHAILNLINHFVYALSIFLALGVLFIIGNSINLAIQKHRREIEVFKLVGATNAFIRRPFLYTGMLFGLIGSIMAWLIVAFLVLWLQTPTQNLAFLYGSHFQLQNLSSSSGMILLGTGILLGLIGAFLAAGKHLRAS